MDTGLRPPWMAKVLAMQDGECSCNAAISNIHVGQSNCQYAGMTLTRFPSSGFVKSAPGCYAFC
jgi:hypothetical protein